MKIGSFSINGRETYGVVLADGVVDVGARLRSRYADLRRLITANALDEAREIAARHGSDFGLCGAVHLPVVPNARKIFCVGLNYHAHVQETHNQETANPTLFMRYALSQVGHGQPMLRPRESAKLDYEGEIAVIIGEGGRRIAEEHSADHIAGYACYNDGSVRDWQRHSPQWGPGKNFFGTGAFGPWMTTADELGDNPKLTLVTRLNGEEMQRADTGLMIFPVPRLIAYCSTILPLEPGDVIVTGTPGGVGNARMPPVYMREGDVVEVEVSGIGVLRNTIAAD